MYVDPSMLDRTAEGVLLLALVGMVGILLAMVWRMGQQARKAEKLKWEKAFLQGSVEEAHQAFIRYAVIHRSKGSEEGEAKARSNQWLADKMHRALVRTGYRPLGPLQAAVFEIGKRMEDAHRHGG